MALEIETLKKPKATMFLTQARNLELVRKEPDETLTPRGPVPVRGSEIVYTAEPGERHGQGNLYGVIFVQPGQHELPIDQRRDLSEPEDLTAETEDAATWIRRHPLFGERIWELEPPAPDHSPVLAEVALLAGQGDVQALEALRDLEAENWNRQVVLDSIDTTLEALKAPA